MAVSEQDLVDFHDSLDRASNSGRFMDVFYDGFVASSIDVEKIFKDTDMERLKRKLKSSLHMMTMLVDDAPGTEMYIGHLARVHDRYSIPPEMFNVWMDLLIEAVRECDSEFDDSVEAIWRDVIGEGIAIMTQGSEAKVFDAV